MGAIGGGVWHGIKGARNSPRVRLFHHPVKCSALITAFVSLCVPVTLIG